MFYYPIMVSSVAVDLLDSCCAAMYCCWEATVNIKQPIPTMKFPSTFISSEVLSFESEIAIAFVKTIKSSGLKLSINVNVTPPMRK